MPDEVAFWVNLTGLFFLTVGSQCGKPNQNQRLVVALEERKDS